MLTIINRTGPKVGFASFYTNIGSRWKQGIPVTNLFRRNLPPPAWKKWCLESLLATGVDIAMVWCKMFKQKDL